MSTRAPDYLVLHGRRRLLLNFPLESYLRELPAKPDFRMHDRANDRGYVATWEVKEDDTLWLIGLHTRVENDGPDPGLQLVFPNATGPIAATWVRLRLLSPDGQPRFSPMGYGKTYASEMLISVHRGKVILLEELHGQTKRRIRSEFTRHLDLIFGLEEAAFIRAAHEAPDDSAPRLIYADWLDERGDRRGEAIRSAERIRQHDPSTRTEEIRTHRSMLRALNSPLWVELMGYDDLALDWE